MKTSSLEHKTVASILQGAYGDYYEQAICLKHLKLTTPGLRLKLFAESSSRHHELSVLDFSFADCFRPIADITADEPIDTFYQFHARDPNFLSTVVPRIPEKLLAKLDLTTHHLPWHYLRQIYPVEADFQMGVSARGAARIEEIMTECGITNNIWKRPTVGFLWRYRSRDGAVRSWFQQDARRLVEKYSKVLSKAIEEFDCHVLVAGMRVKTTEENRRRIDCKYPEYGLDLPESRSTHLKGLSWPLEMEILSRTIANLGHPSGFTEALEIKNPGKTLLVDPVPHYLLKLLRHRMPLFDHNTIFGVKHLWKMRHSERDMIGFIRAKLRNLR